ncbi:hypothetical protein [Streptomyces sp. PanSC9]|uniref:hypothetical protein n=1 Tax=Streptomyces sp. PanSC9 TaxID=1520461 RepID=UPI000F951E88|nr:hypothetical protein [Streptomyces sp. PanSC9]ROP55991.1 hypothetical protein EDD94_5586 [Streptomyces sp. PanSC9]
MRKGLTMTAALAAMTTVSCGGETAGNDETAPGPAPAPSSPYSGSPHGSAAARRALECDGKASDSGGGARSKRDGASSPENALKTYVDTEQPDEPRSGHRAERKEGDRTLHSFDVEGRTKVAVVAAKNQKDPPGRGPQTSASCDPAELPPSLTNPLDHEIWTDPSGERRPVTQISNHRGAEHCERHSAHFPAVSSGKNTRLHARDPAHHFQAGTQLSAPYHNDVHPPAGAHDTGHRSKHRQPWHTHAKTKAYNRNRQRRPP